MADKHKHAIGLFFFLYLLLLMLRARTVGVDLIGYSRIFASYADMPWNRLTESKLEIGYGILNKAISCFTSNFQWFIAITAAITIIPIFAVYKKEIVDSYLSISIFLIMPTFVMFFSGLRQSIAISLGVIAYIFTKKKKLLPFLLVVILAFFFHKSAFVLIFMYPLYWVRITRKSLSIVVPVMTLIFIFSKPIFSLLQSAISGLYNVKSSATNAYSMLILFIVFAVFAFVVPDENELDTDTIGMRNFLLFAIVIQMFAPLHTLAMRFNYYYIVFIPLLIPKIIQSSSARFERIAVLAKYVMIVFFLGYFWLNIAFKSSLGAFPYHFFWENV